MPLPPIDNSSEAKAAREKSWQGPRHVGPTPQELILAGLNEADKARQKEIKIDLGEVDSTVRKIRSAKAKLADPAAIHFEDLKKADSDLREGEADLKAREEEILNKLQAVQDAGFKGLVLGFFKKIRGSNEDEKHG